MYDIRPRLLLVILIHLYSKKGVRVVRHNSKTDGKADLRSLRIPNHLKYMHGNLHHVKTTDITKNEQVATIGKSTYSLGRVGLSSTSTHIALKITNQRAGAAKIGNVAVHYEINESG